MTFIPLLYFFCWRMTLDRVSFQAGSFMSCSIRWKAEGSPGARAIAGGGGDAGLCSGALDAWPLSKI